MKKNMWKKGIVLGVILLFVGASVTPNILVRNVKADPGNIIYVPDDYPSIQLAVNAASLGDTIIVRDGSYYANVNVDKSLTIRSENGPENCSVLSYNSWDHGFEVNADYVNISGFTVWGAYNGYDILLSMSSYCIISNNICYGASGYTGGYGICLLESWNNIILNNTCIVNDYGSILIKDSSNNIILNNTCNGMGISSYGIVVWDSSNNNILSNNTCNSNYEGIYLYNSTNNVIFQNNFLHNYYDGILLWYSSNNTFHSNNLIGNGNNVDSHYSTNIWNSSLQLTYIYNGDTYVNFMGNYWEDYNGLDADGDGIGDIPYNIDGDSDYYPLMEYFENYTIGGGNQPPNKPTLKSPGTPTDTGFIVNTKTPTFEWNEVVDAEYYGLYISEEPYGEENIVYDSEEQYPGGKLYGTSFNELPDDILEDGVKYRWDMRAFNEYGSSDFSSELYFKIDLKPTCNIILKKDGNQIDNIDVGQTFDICITDYSNNIVEIKFLSDENQNGQVDPGYQWNGPYEWDESLGGWDANTKTMKWSLATGGPKEVWAEVNDTIGQTNRFHANIYANFYFVHISDTHVKHYKDQENSKEKWESIIENITSFDPSPEFVIVSGDLVDFGAGLMGDDNYITFRSYLHGSRPNWYLDSEQKIPVYFCPGNHDYREWHPVFGSKWFGDFSLENYQNYVRQPNEDSYRILDPNTNTFIVSLNSGHDKILKGTYFPPRGTGFLPEQMNWLENELDNLDGDLNNDCDTSGYKKIIFMHHPVIYYRENDDWKHWGGHIEGGIWDAGCILNKKTRFLNICDQYGVDVVLSGHTHTNRVYDRDMDGSSFPGDQNGYNNEPFDIAYFPLSTLYKKPLYVITGSNLDGDYRMIQCKSNELLVWKENTIIDIVTSKIIGCPVELHLYDSNGNHVGRNNTGGVDFEIENATYSFNPLEFTDETDPTKWNHTIEEISLPYGFDNYRYQLKGTGEGVFNFSIRKRLIDGIDLIIFYENISITETSMGKLYVYEDSVDYTIYMDDDGDGIVDREIQPDEVICGEVPYPPSTLSGPTKGLTNISYSYSTNTTDPENDQIYYLFHWGDDTDSGWLGPYNSSELCTASHIWTNSGTYCVWVRAKDVDDHISDWSPLLIVDVYDIESTIDIDPDTLNLNSSGKWITCYIELPEGYNVTDINISMILLNDVVPAEDHLTDIGDYDNDGIPDLMVKFDRQDIIDILELGENVAITVTGELTDETCFEGTDYIRVI